MINKFRVNPAVVVCLPAVLLVSACATTSRPADFYTLSSTIVSGGEQAQPAAACRDIVIGIGPVVWPRYLDRPQIVTRRSPYQISFDESVVAEQYTGNFSILCNHLFDGS